jgi:hypothetical protein
MQIGARNFELIQLGSKGTRLCWGKATWVKRDPTLLGQGIVLADTKTARPPLRICAPSLAMVACSMPSAYSPAQRGPAASPRKLVETPNRASSKARQTVHTVASLGSAPRGMIAGRERLRYEHLGGFESVSAGPRSSVRLGAT